MSPAPRRLGAVGTLVWDRIRHPQRAEPVEQWGGAAYSLSALSAACPEGWEVVPLVKVGADVAEQAIAFLRRLPRVHPGAGVRVVPEPNNRVELRYRDGAERQEVLSGGVPPWRWPELGPLLEGLDALYLNFISGHEMELATARRASRAVPGPVYVDLHSLFLGPAPSPGLPRPHRPLPHWQQWLACADVVQLNETELELLAAGAPPADALSRLLDHGPRAAVATFGGAGAIFAERPAGGGAPRTDRVPVPAGALSGDPTGCGDVWGSVVLAGLLEGRPLEEAILRGHRAAARRLQSSGMEHLRDELAAALAG